MAGYSDDEFGIPGIPSRKTTGSPSKAAADQVKSGNTTALAYPNFFPGQGGLPIQLDDDECNGDFARVTTDWTLHPELLGSLRRRIKRRERNFITEQGIPSPHAVDTACYQVQRQ